MNLWNLDDFLHSLHHSENCWNLSVHEHSDVSRIRVRLHVEGVSNSQPP